MRSYRPQELFDGEGRLRPEVAALAPTGERRMGANPHANGGLLRRDLVMPNFADYAVEVTHPGRVDAEATRVMGALLRDVMKQNRRFPPVRPGRDGVQPPLSSVRSDRPRVDGGDLTRRRRSPSLARRPRHGDPQRAYLRGMARRLSADRAARLVLLLRGVHPHCRFDVQSARQMAEGLARDPVATADLVAQLPADFACLAPGPQRVQPPGPGLHRLRHQQESRHYPGLFAARRQHIALGDRSLPEELGPHQCDRGRKAAGAAMARHGLGDQALRCRDRHLGMGEQRPRQRARCRDGVRRRCSDAGDLGRGRSSASPHPRTSRSASSMSST